MKQNKPQETNLKYREGVIERKFSKTVSGKCRPFFQQKSHINFNCGVHPVSVRRGGVMVSVAGIGHRVRGFKHGRSDEFLKTIKICSTPSFGREVKPKVRCRKILRRVKITCKYELKYFRQFLLLATRWQLVLSERISEGIRSFSCRYHSTMVPHAHISLWWWTIDTIVAAVQRCRLTSLTC
jgi:hypothetical protein